MNNSNVKAEQICFDGQVINDFAEILTKNELKKIILSSFKGSYIKNGMIYGSHRSKQYCIYFKNISYLGTPHLLYKKRIQIPRDFKQIYDENISKGITTLLIGIYIYKSLVLFCDFNTKKYITNRLNNSSAHVYTIDLKNGHIFGAFQKTDFKGNEITVFNSANINKYLDNKLIGDVNLNLEMVSVFDEFFLMLERHWHGIACYSEMISANFSNKYQSEWPGFYLEFRFDKYIKENDKSEVVCYRQNKKKDAIDLDLYFPQLSSYGDLKAHSLDSDGIQGNDYKTIMSILENKNIYYIICNHDTTKDKNKGYEVTIFWNKLQNKPNLMSYSERMKNSIDLRSYYILEISKSNMHYLDIFNQGRNSNGAKREPKISIKTKNINNFLIHQLSL